MTKNKQTAASRSMEACFRGMAVGEQVRFQRSKCVIRWTRLEHGMQHVYEPTAGAMHYEVSFRDAADWFTENDGKGAWSMMTNWVEVKS